MKNPIAIIATIAALLFTSAADADYFRVFYYVEKGDKVYGPDGVENFEAPRGRPYKYTTEAKTECAAYCELIEAQPAAVDVTINNLDE